MKPNRAWVRLGSGRRLKERPVQPPFARHQARRGGGNGAVPASQSRASRRQQTMLGHGERKVPGRVATPAVGPRQPDR
jgi:hypothetical protein